MTTNRPLLLKILILAVSLSLWGCGTDELPPSKADGGIAHEAKDLHNPIQIMGLKELGDRAEVREALSRLASPEVNKAGKDNLPDLYGFSVDTVRIKAMVHGKDSSYTFLAKRKGNDGSFFENLVLQRTAQGGGLEAFLVRYHTDGGISPLEGHATFAFEGHREVFPLDVDRLGLGTAAKETICYTLVEVWCSYGGDHPAGTMCHAEAAQSGDDRIYDRYSTVCVSTGGGGGTTDPGPGDGGSGGGGGSNNTYIVTAPANLDLYDWEQKRFEREKLFEVERSYYHSNSNIRNIIDAFLVDEEFSNAAMFEAKGHLFFGQGLPLSPQQFVWYFRNSGSTEVLDLKQFLMRQGYGPAAVEFGLEAIDVWMDGEEELELELEELFLESRLMANPYMLLDIDCDQIAHWQALAQHTAPQSVQSKINGLQQNHDGPFGDWEIQQLENANGTIVNLDYFSVNITQFPIDPNTGQPFTPVQFIDYFRRNINDFVDNTTFEPYCEISAICQQETNLWNSNNPLGAVVKLDVSMYGGIGGNSSGNDGVLVCAEYNSNYWRFMTLEAPWDWSHPVSGTRQFGIEQMPNGSYNVYVRGVDRFTSNLQQIVSDAIFDSPFDPADALWESFQDKTNDFINDNGGSSGINIPVHNRPDWEEVQDVLQGNKPISDLKCD